MSILFDLPIAWLDVLTFDTTSHEQIKRSNTPTSFTVSPPAAIKTFEDQREEFLFYCLDCTLNGIDISQRDMHDVKYELSLNELSKSRYIIDDITQSTKTYYTYNGQTSIQLRIPENLQSYTFFNNYTTQEKNVVYNNALYTLKPCKDNIYTGLKITNYVYTPNITFENSILSQINYSASQVYEIKSLLSKFNDTIMTSQSSEIDISNWVTFSEIIKKADPVVPEYLQSETDYYALNLDNIDQFLLDANLFGEITHECF